MPGRTLMIQGTGSHVGKTVLVTALCRIFRQDGLRVAPFKAQNMSNNAFVCRDGGEIARAQALQAVACGEEPAVEMNPVLLKPCTDTGSQVIVRGRPTGTMNAKEYQAFKLSLIPMVRESLARLRDEHDLVVIEGAGSPAEINLRDRDIANMRTAALADAPVILVGDIDFGGVFAQLIGTMHLLQPEERARIRGFVINKFRGDPDILRPGIEFVERETGRQVLGVLPFFRDIRLSEEDTIPPARLGGAAPAEKILIDVIKLPRIANFTDFDALDAEPDVHVNYLERPDGRIPDALILPGTKSTIPDLKHLKASGFPTYIDRCLRHGAVVVGICGGFQMLGARIFDPSHVESSAEVEDGLGLLPAITFMQETKETAQVRGVHLESGIEVAGYEIHMGCTQEDAGVAPLIQITERFGMPADDHDGLSASGDRVWGTYLHGLFDSPEFRRYFINRLRAARGWAAGASSSGPDPEAEIDKLARIARAHLDVRALYRIVGHDP